MDISEGDSIRMKESLQGISDPRREWGNLRHKLIDMEQFNNNMNKLLR
jgi:hypothetical protein